MSIKLKFYCPRGHSWFGDHVRSVCPFCGASASGSMDQARYRVVADRVWLGIERSIIAHGDWLDYGLIRIAWVIGGELWEVVWALLRGDIHGRHGVINELRDLAVVCMKGVERLERRKLE